MLLYFRRFLEKASDIQRLILLLLKVGPGHRQKQGAIGALLLFVL
jgi:hypothetical protein